MWTYSDLAALSKARSDGSKWPDVDVVLARLVKLLSALLEVPQDKLIVGVADNYESSASDDPRRLAHIREWGRGLLLTICFDERDVSIRMQCFWREVDRPLIGADSGPLYVRLIRSTEDSSKLKWCQMGNVFEIQNDLSFKDEEKMLTAFASELHQSILS